MKLYYWNEKKNFGDGLSPLLVQKLLDCSVKYAHVEEADLIAVGSMLLNGNVLRHELRYRRNWLLSLRDYWNKCSLLRKRKRQLIVWGAGFLIRPNLKFPTFPLQTIMPIALRGKLTHRLLYKFGRRYAKFSPAYGDPGLLYSILLDTIPEKKFDIAIVPHYIDGESGRELFDELKGRGNNIVFVDVQAEDPMEPLKLIAESRVVISSSLHGLIVADGMGIPNVRVSFSTFGFLQEDYDFKYKDYYSAFDMEMQRVFEPSEIVENSDRLIEFVRENYKVDSKVVEKVKENLLGALKKIHD